MKTRRIVILALFVLMTLSLLTGCGGSAEYRDGAYTGRSSIHESEGEEGQDAGYGIADITIQGGAITACDFRTYQPDGTLKDVDAISGATVSFTEFQEAVGDALNQAKK